MGLSGPILALAFILHSGATAAGNKQSEVTARPLCPSQLFLSLSGISSIVLQAAPSSLLLSFCLEPAQSNNLPAEKESAPLAIVSEYVCEAETKVRYSPKDVD